MPYNSALPTPTRLPGGDGCVTPTYGGGLQDCIAHGLPPGAPVTLTADGVGVFLRIGPTVVSADGTYYFPWYHDEGYGVNIIFVVRAGDVARTFTGLWR